MQMRAHVTLFYDWFFLFFLCLFFFEKIYQHHLTNQIPGYNSAVLRYDRMWRQGFKSFLDVILLKVSMYDLSAEWNTGVISVCAGV